MRKRRNQELLRSLGIDQHRQLCRSEPGTGGKRAVNPISGQVMRSQKRRAKRVVCDGSDMTKRRSRRVAGESVEIPSEAFEGRSQETGPLWNRVQKEKSSSFGRQAFWEVVAHFDQAPNTGSIVDMNDPKHLPPTPQKGRTNVVNNGSLGPRRRAMTEEEKRAQRQAIEARFCSDLPRHAVSFAIQRQCDWGSFGPQLASMVVAPFSLLSIAVTVHSLGQLVVLPKDPDTERKWFSSRMAMYVHPFPDGYHCSKEHWGRRWHMYIRRDRIAGGPIFTVCAEDGKESYTRHTPSHAWMDACLASHAPGTRISGPLFYGFSDVWLQRVIQKCLVQNALDASKNVCGTEPFILGSYRMNHSL